MAAPADLEAAPRAAPAAWDLPSRLALAGLIGAVCCFPVGFLLSALALVLARKGAPSRRRVQRLAVAGLALAVALGVGFQLWRQWSEPRLVRALGDIKIEIPLKAR